MLHVFNHTQHLRRVDDLFTNYFPGLGQHGQDHGDADEVVVVKDW